MHVNIQLKKQSRLNHDETIIHVTVPHHIGEVMIEHRKIFLLTMHFSVINGSISQQQQQNSTENFTPRDVQYMCKKIEHFLA